MSRYVQEIMNPELLAFRPTDTAAHCQSELYRVGIRGAPVLDSDGRPLGIVSLLDLAKAEPESQVRHCMTAPAVSVRADAGVLEAARLMGRTGLHRLVVVDAEGIAVGLISTLDVIRALTALPVTHPASFPHFDRKTGQVWTDPAELTLDAILTLAPEAPGVFVLLHDAPGVPTTVVWAEAVENLSARLLDLVSMPQGSELDHFLAFRDLRFRLAVVEDVQRRHVLVDRLRHEGRSRFANMGLNGASA